MYVAKTKALINRAVTAQLICAFVFAYMQKIGFLLTQLKYKHGVIKPHHVNPKGAKEEEDKITSAKFLKTTNEKNNTTTASAASTTNKTKQNKTKQNNTQQHYKTKQQQKTSVQSVLHPFSLFSNFNILGIGLYHELQALFSKLHLHQSTTLYLFITVSVVYRKVYVFLGVGYSTDIYSLV